MMTPPAFTFTPADAGGADDWVSELDVNPHGLRLLTLPRAQELASAGCCAGWYISPFALQWTVGRMTAAGRRFHVISEGEPIRFASMAEAHRFLGQILRVPAAPELSPDWLQPRFGSVVARSI